MYEWPVDKSVLENLKKWQGYKFGVLIHFGLYSETGIVESWALCPEDEGWISRDGYADYNEFANDYRNIRKRLNPINLNPDKWAKAIKNAGAKYMIFSTKHHDGFCLYDSKYTDFKITGKDCPFSIHSKSDIFRYVMDAFRNEGLAVGAYFSKPDWTTPYFWWPYFPPKDRNPNYDIKKHPEQWNKFIEYTHNQLYEICTNYSKIDILWLDGCWVRPLSTINERVEEFCKYPHDMDINMNTIIKKIREKQPGMIVVDRWVDGENENYLTPEQKIPETASDIPWESCITMGTAWGWTPNEKFKTARELIQLLIKIVAKGGNLLLGFGPDGKGIFDPVVYDRLNEIGEWLEINGDAIYETVPVAPYQEGKIAYTKKGNNTLFAIYLPENEEYILPSVINIKANLGTKAEITVLSSGLKLEYNQEGEEIRIHIPDKIKIDLASMPAVVFKLLFS